MTKCINNKLAKKSQHHGVLVALLLLTILVIPVPSWAEVSVDTAYNPTVDDNVHIITVQPDGKALIAGRFSTVSGVTRNHIARLNADGNLDPSFVSSTPPADSIVAIVLQPDGKVLIAGNEQMDDYNDGFIVRLNSNGSLDPTFTSPPIQHATINEAALQPDGKILIIVNGYISRVNTDGSYDTSFNTNINSRVSSIAIQPDAKVIIVGGFTEVNGVARDGFARLNPNGSLDTSFNPYDINISQGGIGGLLLQPDGKVLVNFGYKCGPDASCSRIYRLNADGSLDSNFDTSIFSAIDTTYDSGFAAAMALQTDGKILVGGGFAAVNGVVKNNIARLNTDGSLDPSFDLGKGPNGLVSTISLQPDSKALISGDFTLVDGIQRNYIARLILEDTHMSQNAGAQFILQYYLISKPTRSLPPTKTELEGKWIQTTSAISRTFETYVFSGNKYDYLYVDEDFADCAPDPEWEECNPEKWTEMGTFVIGDSFNAPGWGEATKIDFNRELVDGESNPKTILKSYMIDSGLGGSLVFGDREGNDFFYGADGAGFTKQ